MGNGACPRDGFVVGDGMDRGEEVDRFPLI